MIKPLELHEQCRLVAAQGWIELGNYLETNEELENITPENHAHPDVLEIRWQVYAKARKWEGVLETASALVRLVPEHPLGWVHRSYSLHEMKRSEEARDSLLRVVDRFPDGPIMRYNLACYACRLGNLKDARDWLQRAFETGYSEKLKLLALEGPDLEPYRRKIGEI